jgi:hypothetical protein
MIWDPSAVDGTSESAVVSHIVGEVGAVCGGQMELGAHTVEEVARAVECFLQREAGAEFVDPKYLAMLTSSALSAVGAAGAARRLFLFGTGLVAPSEWEVTVGEEMWVVDLKQMTVRDDAALELLFFRSIQIVIESIADVWDGPSGGGSMGLRHVCATAQILLGGAGKKKQVDALAGEIVAAAAGKLKQVAEARSWQRVPRVINLDF